MDLAERLKVIAPKMPESETHSSTCWKWHDRCALMLAAELLESEYV